MFTFETMPKFFNCLRLEKTSGNDPVKPVFWICRVCREVRLRKDVGMAPAIDNDKWLEGIEGRCDYAPGS